MEVLTSNVFKITTSPADRALCSSAGACPSLVDQMTYSHSADKPVRGDTIDLTSTVQKSTPESEGIFWLKLRGAPLNAKINNS